MKDMHQVHVTQRLSIGWLGIKRPRFHFCSIYCFLFTGHDMRNKEGPMGIDWANDFDSTICRRLRYKQARRQLCTVAPRQGILKELRVIGSQGYLGV